MKARSLLTAILVGITAPAILGAAEKQKRPDVSNYPFWPSQKRGFTNQYVPGLTAALQITDAQAEQILKAREEMSNEESVKAVRGLGKNDPNVTAEQRDKARAAMEAANARLRERVAAILTPEQKTLIEKISAAYAAASEDTGIVYQEKFASVKGDDAARKRIQEEKNQDMQARFNQKLDAVLSPAQKDAMKRAADDERERAAKAATAKKPAK